MAEVTTKLCDACESPKDVDTMMVVYHYGKQRPWEVDICQKCYDTRFKDLLPKSRNSMKVNTRPQYRLVKTQIGPENL